MYERQVHFNSLVFAVEKERRYVSFVMSLSNKSDIDKQEQLLELSPDNRLTFPEVTYFLKARICYKYHCKL